MDDSPPKKSADAASDLPFRPPGHSGWSFACLANPVRKSLGGLGERVVYLVVRSIICVIQILPLSTCDQLCHGLAWLFHRVLRVRQGVIRDNLRQALPDRTPEERVGIERAMWLHLFQMICEIALAGRKIHETNWRKYYRITNCRALVEGFIRPRGAIAATAHFGNFEMCGYISGLLGFPTHTIARPLDNRHLHQFLTRFRGATGQFVLPTKGSAEQVLRVIEAGETVALLGDHYGGRKGCWVDFFDRKASSHKATSLLCLAHQIPLIVVYTKRRRAILQFELNCLDVYDPVTDPRCLDTVPDLTRWYNRHIENAVRQAPGQYWWLHRRWKDPRKKKIRSRVSGSPDGDGSSSAPTGVGPSAERHDASEDSAA